MGFKGKFILKFCGGKVLLFMAYFSNKGISMFAYYLLGYTYIDGGLKWNINSTVMYMIVLLHVAFHIVVYYLTIHFILCFCGKDYNPVTVEPMILVTLNFACAATLAWLITRYTCSEVW